MPSAISIRPVLYTQGLLVAPLGLAMLVPGVVDLLAGDVDWQGFFTGGLVTTLLGLLLVFSNQGTRVRLDLRQAFLFTALVWVLVSIFGAFPFMFSRLALSPADALFESVSGLTTTGSTVISGLDDAPPGILLWRSMLQWLGGIGIIMMAIVLLPMLRVGGMQLFRMESSETEEKAVPQVSQLGLAVVSIYVTFTIACIVGYLLGGMTPFEAVNHAMTTVATGGYSTSDASIGYFDSRYIEWVGIVFMILGSLPFALYVRFLRRQPAALLRNVQVKGFLIFLLMVWFGFSGWLVLDRGLPFLEAFTLVAFNVTSVVTTTGYASADYSLWGPLALALFFVLTFVGGCTGSTAGGIKIFRFQVAVRLYMTQTHRLVSPNVVAVPRYGERRIEPEVAQSVLLFFFVFIVTVGVISVILGGLGLDWLTAVSGAATAVANVGPGLGPIIGPAGNFSVLPDAAKWVLSVGMLLGRLEFFTILVLISRRYWRG